MQPFQKPQLCLCILKPPLTAAGILGIILNVQKLDKFDIEGVSALYQRLTKHRQQGNRAPQPPDVEIHDQIGGPPDEVEFAKHRKATSQLLALPVSEALGVIKDYLIAATAKDCSIMVACRHCPDSIPVLSGVHHNFEYQVKVADLDLKAASKIVAHMEVDAEIIATHRALQAEGLA